MKRFALLVFATLTLSLGLTACGSDTGGDNNGNTKSCQTTEDCADQATCFSGQCVTPSGDQCADDLDCQPWEYCGDGTCKLAACDSDDQCAESSICDNNRCRTGCRNDDECGEGKRCSQVSFTCEVQGCETTGCPTFQFCDDSLAPSECRYDGSCGGDNPERVCNSYARQVDDGNEYICQDDACVVKPPCEGNADCETGEICIIVDDGRNYCRAGCETDDDCLFAEYCSDDQRCVEGCNSNADCTGENDVCFELQCEVGCSTRDQCETAGLMGYVCTGDPAHCQTCTDDNQCYGAEFCDLQADGTPEGRGLCTELPPECPDDGFGDNHNQANAEEITTFPYEKTADERPLFCQEHTGGEWFWLTADPGKVITAEIEYDNTVGGNLDLALVDGDGNDLMTSARPPDEDDGLERIEYGIRDDAAGPTDVYIQIRGNLVQAKAAYRIRVNVRDPQADAGDSFEENDSKDAAVSLPASTRHKNLGVCGDDPDFYELSVMANQIITVELTSDPRLGQIDFFLLDADGTTLPNSADNSDQSLTQRIQYAAQNAGTYYVEVRMASGVGCADYELSWSTQDNVCNDVLEGNSGNDSCGTAAQVSDGDSYSDLNICEDSDWYCTTLRPLDRLRVTATYDPATAAGALQMTLFGPNDCGAFLTSATEQSVSGSTETQLVIADPNDPSQGYQAQLGGTYCVLASRFSGIQVPYSLQVDVVEGPTCTDDSREDNDDAANAVSIDPAQVVNNGPQSALLGLKTCDYDEDWYSIDIADGDTLKWVIDQDTSAGEIGATLMEDGTTPVTDTNGDPITLDADGAIEVTNTTGSTKTYYLKVAGANGLPVRNDYQLLTYINGSGTADPDCPDIYENNDTSSAAVSLGAGTESNLLVCGGDDDWYKTTLSAGETITVTASFDNAGGNIDLSLYEDSNLTSPIERSNTSADTEMVTYTTARDQDVYYRVNTSTAVDGNDYALDVAITPPSTCIDDGYEDNDASGSATQVESPGLYSRLMSCEDDADWYEVDLTSGQKFEAYINYDATRADLDVEIYAPSDLTTPAASGDNKATYTPTTDGTHYVRVASADPTVSVRLGYDLLLYRDLDGNGSFEAGEGPADRDCPDAYENNDSFNNAAAIPAGTYDDLLMCSRSPVDDADYYQVYVPAGATITVDLSFTNADGNIELRLYNESRSLVDSSTTTNDTETVTAQNTDSIGRTYYVHVDGASQAFQNYYQMTVGLQFQGTCSGDQFDPNGDKASAATLSAGAYELTLCENTGDDWFTFDLPAGQSFTAHAELRNRLGDVDIELQDDAGTVLDSSTTSTNIETLDYTNSSGSTETLYLRAFPKGGALMRNDYDLWAKIGNNSPTAPYCPDDYERNDATDSAADFDFAANPQIDDAIMCSTEEDWYKVDLFGTPTYEFKTFFDHSADFDLAIEVRDENGNLVPDGSGGDLMSDTADNDEMLSFQPPASGTYFIGVKQTGTNAAVQGNYGLYFADDSASCPEDGYEANNTPATAKLLNQGFHSLASCQGSNSEQDDYFSFQPIADGTLSIEVMYDDTQLQLTGSFDSFSPNMSSSKNRLTYTTSVTAGQTYVMYLGNVSGEGPYFIDVSYQ